MKVLPIYIHQKWSYPDYLSFRLSFFLSLNDFRINIMLSLTLIISCCTSFTTIDICTLLLIYSKLITSSLLYFSIESCHVFNATKRRGDDCWQLHHITHHHTTLHYTTPHHTTLHHTTSYHTTPHHTTPHHTTSYHTTTCHTTTCHITTCHTTTYHTTTHYTAPYYNMPYYIIPYYTTLHHTTPHHTTPYHTTTHYTTY